MMGLHSPSWSRGKLPRSGGIGLADFCPPPGPPKLIALNQHSKSPGTPECQEGGMHSVIKRVVAIWKFVGDSDR